MQIAFGPTLAQMISALVSFYESMKLLTYLYTLISQMADLLGSVGVSDRVR